MSFGGDPTADLLARLVSPEPTQAWQEFLEAYAPLLQQITRLVETDNDAAADCFVYICQELAANQFRRLSRFKSAGSASFTTWLRAVARNLSIDWHRKRYGRVRNGVYPSALVTEALEPEDAAGLKLKDPRPDPEMLAATRESETVLRRLVAGLREEDRLLIQLRYEQDLTLQQIAGITGIKDAQTVDRRIREVMQSIRENLLHQNGKFRTRSV